MNNDEIQTIDRAIRHEIEKINGSRFISDAAPATDESACLAWVDSIRHQEPGATHHCWAYRLSDGRERSSDDGEPGGTAGPPILRRIQGLDLHDIVVVVTRYYGGTNLGTGGLIRAYGGAAAAVLKAASIVSRPILSAWELVYPYGLSSPITQVLTSFEASIVESDYGERVRVVAAVRAGSANEFVDAIREATSGAVTAQPVTTIS
jgi:uncharacterized YigZ family protein